MSRLNSKLGMTREPKLEARGEERGGKKKGRRKEGGRRCKEEGGVRKEGGVKKRIHTMIDPRKRISHPFSF
jgi:hypothetical protein